MKIENEICFLFFTKKLTYFLTYGGEDHLPIMGVYCIFFSNTIIRDIVKKLSCTQVLISKKTKIDDFTQSFPKSEFPSQELTNLSNEMRGFPYSINFTLLLLPC